jgi:hypothetical protein
VTHPERKRIVEFANKNRLPGIYAMTDFAIEGGLLSYSADVNDMQQLAAVYVDRVLRGAKPASLPIEQPTKFELVVNLKTAKTLGIKNTRHQDCADGADPGRPRDRMNRRDTVLSLLALGAAPLAVQAQRVFRIGVLIHGTERTYGARVEALRAGLRELGYVEGRNLICKQLTARLGFTCP